MIKNFVLDTNVLIHNPQAIYSFGDNGVILPITVIEELDRFKSHADKKGMHARQVLREIDGLIKKGALKKGAKMINGGILRIAFSPRDTEWPDDMDPKLEDNKILGVAWKIQKEGETVFFISKDVNARIKAEALGIRSADYEKQKVEYGMLYKGYRDMVLSPEELASLKMQNRWDVKGMNFFDNEYAVIRTSPDSKPVKICKYDAEYHCLVPVDTECEVMGIVPLNTEQRIALDLLLNDQIKLVTLVGQAGTGKTLLALASALHKIVRKNPRYEKLLVVRPIIPLGKDIGYLPGSKEKKLNYWMQPIFDNLDFILKKSLHSGGKEWTTSDLTTDNLLGSEILEVEALTYIRGRSIPDQFFIVDEAQNLTPHEIKTIVSRAGEGTKIVLTGDPDQIDNPYLDANSNGLSYTVDRLKRFGLFGHVLLSHSERSQLAALAVEEL